MWPRGLGSRRPCGSPSPSTTASSLRLGYLAGISQASALVQEALEALVQREAARRLARFGGSQANVAAAPRRR